MSSKSPLSLVISILVLLAIGYFTFFANNYGAKVTNGQIEVYYKDGVTKHEADRLASLLAREWANAPDKRSVQLVKTDGQYRFRMVVKPEYQNDPDFNANMSIFGSQIAREILNSQPLEMDVCDERLKTIKSVPILQELLNRVKKDRFSVYYAPDISKEQAEKLLEWLTKEFATNQNQVDLSLKKQTDTIIVSMPYKKEFLERPEIIEELNIMAKKLSQDVFDGATTELTTCDPMFRVFQTFKSQK